VKIRADDLENRQRRMKEAYSSFSTRRRRRFGVNPGAEVVEPGVEVKLRLLDALNRRFETRCAKAGVRRITVHDMRHTCATLLAALDVHPRVAMRIPAACPDRRHDERLHRGF
jgi:integrase